MDKKKSLFSKKGNSDEYNYMENQKLFIVVAAVIFIILIALVELGFL